MNVLALAWFRKSDWQRWLEICPGAFEPDYDHWLKRCEGQMKALERQGILVEKVMMDPDKYLAWCQEHEFDPCELGMRGRYATIIFAERLTGP
jgi:hypothetical protein